MLAQAPTREATKGFAHDAKGLAQRAAAEVEPPPSSGAVDGVSLPVPREKAFHGGPQSIADTTQLFVVERRYCKCSDEKTVLHPHRQER